MSLLRSSRPRALVAPLALGATLLFACGGGAGSESAGSSPALAGKKLVSAKCSFCHSLGSVRGPLAPTLAQAVQTARAWTEDYGARIDGLEAAFPEVHAAQSELLEGILAESDAEARFSAWLDAYLQDPKFDDPNSKMQKVVLTPLEREQIIAHILTLP